MNNPSKRIIVKFRPTPDVNSQTLSELCDLVARMTNGILVRQPSASGRAVFELEASSDLQRLILQIQQLPSVEYAEADVIERGASRKVR